MSDPASSFALTVEGTTRMLVLTQVAVTWALVGLIWTIQLVHYPLFRLVGEATFSQYHAAHSTWISVLVMPLMLAELAVAVLLVLFPPAPAFGVRGVVWAGLGLALVGVVWLSTFALSVPQHNALASGFDARAHALLVSTNWVRTVVWTARGLLALLLVSRL